VWQKPRIASIVADGPKAPDRRGVDTGRHRQGVLQLCVGAMIEPLGSAETETAPAQLVPHEVIGPDIVPGAIR
jgi:hypothetical protein